MQRRISPLFLGASTGRARALEQQSETGAGRAGGGVSSSLKSLSDTDEVRVSSLSHFFGYFLFIFFLSLSFSRANGGLAAALLWFSLICAALINATQRRRQRVLTTGVSPRLDLPREDKRH